MQPTIRPRKKRYINPRVLKWSRGILCTSIIVLTIISCFFHYAHNIWSIVLIALAGTAAFVIVWLYFALIIPEEHERIEKYLIELYEKCDEDGKQ